MGTETTISSTQRIMESIQIDVRLDKVILKGNTFWQASYKEGRGMNRVTYGKTADEAVSALVEEYHRR